MHGGINYENISNRCYRKTRVKGGRNFIESFTGKVGWALQQDYADAAAAVLSGSGFENTIYELSGEPMTQEELTAALGSILGKEVVVHQVDDDAYADAMKRAGVPDFVVPMLVDIQKAIRDGALDITSSDFGKLLGRKATPISDGLAQIVRGLSNK